MTQKIVEISSLTESEYIKIVSTFLVLTKADFQCSLCKKKYHRDPVKQELLFKQKNCTTVAPRPFTQFFGKYAMKGSANVKYMTCPANFYDSGSANIISMSNQYENGTMPYGGGFLDQPAKFVEIMDLVHNLKNEHQREQEELLNKYKR